jgi:hypothetical protein
MPLENESLTMALGRCHRTRYPLQCLPVARERPRPQKMRDRAVRHFQVRHRQELSRIESLSEVNPFPAFQQRSLLLMMTALPLRARLGQRIWALMPAVRNTVLTSRGQHMKGAELKMCSHHPSSARQGPLGVASPWKTRRTRSFYLRG